MRFAAFQMFRNYDGSGSAFGDTGLQASSSDVAASSVHASRDSAGNIVLVVINKTTLAKPARLVIAGSAAPTALRGWVLTAASTTPARQPDQSPDASGTFTYLMPAMSVSTLVLTPN